MNLLEATAHPPVTPNGPTAQEWILKELAKGKYAASRPTWFDDLSTDVRNWLDSLRGGKAGSFPSLGPIVIVVIIGAVLLIAFLVFGLPRLNRRSRVAGELFGEDDRRTAAEILRAARAAAAADDFSLAIVEGMRASARALAERTLLTMFPGTTAHEFARRAADLFPDERARLESVAASFDGVRYLGASGTASDWRMTEALAVALRSARVAGATNDGNPDADLPAASELADA